MDDIIIIAVLAVIVGLAAWYVYRSKKRGKRCIGCPHGCCNAKGCGSEKAEGCSCGGCGAKGT